MKVRTSIIAAGAAVVLGTTGALLVPAVASAHSGTKTLTFISVTGKSVGFGKTAFAQQDTDLNAAGTKTVGFDMLYIAFSSPNTGTLNVTVDTKGGFLYGTATVTKSGGVSNGKVTGGTGAFAKATGTFTAKNLNPKGTRTLVTVKYST
jgi:hypothetical protein